jgi:cytochrome bd ubiquinol oxidase subunit II
MVMFLVSLLAISVLLYLLLDGFDLGVGMLLGTTNSEDNRRTMLNTIGLVWDGNETWLVVTGLILCGALPIVYATLLSAFYVPVIVMLLGLILRGVSFEFRNKSPHTHWLCDLCFAIGSLAANFMQGVMVGLLLEDLKFIDGKYSGGLFGSFNDFSVLCGVSYTTTTIGLSKWSR